MIKNNMMQQKWVVIGVCVVVLVMLVGLAGCNWFDRKKPDSPTGPVGSAVELGNYAQQAGQSRVVTVNGATHQINGVISGSVVAGGLYIEINEQSSVGQPAGTDQVAVSLQDVKITFMELPSKISAITVRSDSTEVGTYAVTDGSVEIALTWAQWTQWYGPAHYAVICEAVGNGRLVESMAAVAGRLPSGEVVTFGKGFSPDCPECPPCAGGGTCPGGTCDPNGLPVFVNNGDGTVTDTRTGLTWLQDANCNANLGGINKVGMLDWYDAQTWVAALRSGNCGLMDGSTVGQWRQPTIKELWSLIDYSNWNPALPGGHPFTNVQNDSYWSSTDCAPGTNAAWTVYLRFGYVYNSSKVGMPNFVWPVR